jgi:hypothetical protein
MAQRRPGFASVERTRGQPCCSVAKIQGGTGGRIGLAGEVKVRGGSNWPVSSPARWSVVVVGRWSRAERAVEEWIWRCEARRKASGAEEELGRCGRLGKMGSRVIRWRRLRGGLPSGIFLFFFYGPSQNLER